MTRSLVIASLALSLTACSTMNYTAAQPQSSEPGVRVIYEYPQEAKFKSLGTINVDHYQPGWRAPTVSDVLPKLKDKAASVGGNALIVRSHQVGQFGRTIQVSAEVLSVD